MLSTNERIALTPEEAAEKIGVCKLTVYNLLRRASDPLPAVKIGRRYLIPVRLLEDWLARQAGNC